MPNLKLSKPNKLILIGASTGGPGHIQKILSQLSEQFQGTIIIAQHMGEEYIPSFAQQLNSSCKLTVTCLCQHQVIQANQVYVCGKTTRLVYHMEQLRAEHCLSTDNIHAYNPDINVLFHSATKLSKKLAMMVIVLTGIGADGATGCQVLSAQGVECLAESEKTAIVYGMPMQAIKKSPNIQELDLEAIILRINIFGEMHV